MKRVRSIIFWLVILSLTFACSSLPLGESKDMNSSQGGGVSSSGSDSVPKITVTPAVTLPPTWTPTTIEEESSSDQISIGKGWVRYQTENFSLSLPEEWSAVDVNEWSAYEGTFVGIAQSFGR